MSTVESATTASATGTLTGGASAGGASTLTDLDDFLGLLTAQLRNQDPLNPQDGTEFVEQIATFTGVEQQINTNNKLDELIAIQTSNALSDLADWVGREVSAPGMEIDYRGGEIQLTTPDSAGAQSAELVIRDLTGVEVARVAADPRGGPVTWDGLSNEGVPAGADRYRIEFAFTTNTVDGPQLRTETPRSQGRVIEARINDSGATELLLEGGLVVVDPDAVDAIQADAIAGAAQTETGALDQAAEVVETAEELVETVVNG